MSNKVILEITVKRDQLRCYTLDCAAAESKVTKFLSIQHTPVFIYSFLFKTVSPHLPTFPSGFSQGFNKQIHGPRPHQCQRGVPAVPEQRAPLQLHHPQVLPGANQTLPEPAAEQGQGAKGKNGAPGERPGEAQEHLCTGRDSLRLVFLVFLVWFEGELYRDEIWGGSWL